MTSPLYLIHWIWTGGFGRRWSVQASLRRPPESLGELKMPFKMAQDSQRCLKMAPPQEAPPKTPRNPNWPTRTPSDHKDLWKHRDLEHPRCCQQVRLELLPGQQALRMELHHARRGLLRVPVPLRESARARVCCLCPWRWQSLAPGRRHAGGTGHGGGTGRRSERTLRKLNRDGLRSDGGNDGTAYSTAWRYSTAQGPGNGTARRDLVGHPRTARRDVIGHPRTARHGAT